MSRKVKCPECYTEQYKSSFDRCGCWFCSQQEDTERVEEAFQNFMGLDEEDRWRKLWEMAGGETQ